MDEEYEQRVASRAQQKQENKRKQRDFDEVMDELVPKATGRQDIFFALKWSVVVVFSNFFFYFLFLSFLVFFREAMIEKKKAVGASRRKSLSPEAEFGESDLMGGGGSFKAA